MVGSKQKEYFCDYKSTYQFKECQAQIDRLHKKLKESHQNSIVIRDMVHGLIDVDEKFLKIIDLCKFQRLRRIIQLGSVNLVYPGSYHTRFDHSLGVFHLANKLLNKLDTNDCPKPIRDEIEIKKEQTRAAALLHDLCHGPYSHVSEEIWRLAVELDHIDNKFTKYGKKSLHEIWTSEYLKQHNCVNASIKKIFDYNDQQVEDLANMIVKRNSLSEADKNRIPPSLHSIINSSIDVDKMDYYIRDATVVGVPYGKIDLDRLLMFFTVQLNDDTGEYDLCIREKAIISVQNMMMARKLYYPSVVFHKVPVIAEGMLVRCFKEILTNQLFDKRKYSSAYDFVETFRIWDDFQASHFLNSIKEEKVRDFANSIHNRKLLKRIVVNKKDINDNLWVNMASPDQKTRAKVEMDIAERVKINPFYIIICPEPDDKDLDFKIYDEKEKTVRTLSQQFNLIDTVPRKSKKKEKDSDISILKEEVVSVYSPSHKYKEVEELLKHEFKRGKR